MTEANYSCLSQYVNDRDAIEDGKRYLVTITTGGGEIRCYMLGKELQGVQGRWDMWLRGNHDIRPMFDVSTFMYDDGRKRFATVSYASIVSLQFEEF